MADIRTFTSVGPWTAKSGGELTVLFALPWDTLAAFFRYDNNELSNVPGDIRGLRCYRVKNVPDGGIGGMEFHRIREEIIVCLRGAFTLECEDIKGRRRRFRLKNGRGIWIPPYVLHTYKALANRSGLLVVANTLFDPNNHAMRDTYSQEAFRMLRSEQKTAKQHSKK
ncbi:MAG: WxcM-like domain-containing protein [Candidatus Uhrbacteria bacterium]